jgi:hypothetical protein
MTRWTAEPSWRTVKTVTASGVCMNTSSVDLLLLKVPATKRQRPSPQPSRARRLRSVVPMPWVLVSVRHDERHLGGVTTSETDGAPDRNDPVVNGGNEGRLLAGCERGEPPRLLLAQLGMQSEETIVDGVL